MSSDQPGFDSNEPEKDPLAELLAGLSGAQLPPEVAAALAQLHSFVSVNPGAGGPVNWSLATTVARQVVSGQGDPSMTISDHRAADDALRLADTWLSEHTILPPAGARALAWSAAEWVEASQPIWKQVVEPVAQSVAQAMATALAEQPQTAEHARPALLEQLSGNIFGVQVGQAIGSLATEIVSGTEIGLPLFQQDTVVLLPHGITRFGAGLGIDPHEIRLYLAVRESARARLFAHVPWLKGALLGSVEQYARGISIDTQRIAQAISELDLSDPAAMQQGISEGMFAAHTAPEQAAALIRLETLLALLEGWVDVLCVAATTGLPQAGALHEVVRRRRATGGPAEQAFSALVGLELRPRRLREAAALWTALGDEAGLSARDAIWSHPDLLPTEGDLADPASYLNRRRNEQSETADVDAAIARLLAEENPDSGQA